MAAAGAPDGMEEPGMDTEAKTVATEALARPLNCLEAEATAGAGAETVAEDSGTARGSLQPAACSRPRPRPLETPCPRLLSATAKTRAAAQTASWWT